MVEFLINSDEYKDQQARLLYQTYKNFNGSTMDYSLFDNYQKIVATKVPQRSFFIALNHKEVTAIIIIDLDGSLALNLESNSYDIAFFAFSDENHAIRLLEFTLSKLEYNTNFYRMTDVHIKIATQLSELSTHEMWYDFEFSFQMEDYDTLQKMIMHDQSQSCLKYKIIEETVYIKEVDVRYINQLYSSLLIILKEKKLPIVLSNQFEILGKKEEEGDYEIKNSICQQLCRIKPPYRGKAMFLFNPIIRLSL